MTSSMLRYEGTSPKGYFQRDNLDSLYAEESTIDSSITFTKCLIRRVDIEDFDLKSVNFFDGRVVDFLEFWENDFANGSKIDFTNTRLPDTIVFGYLSAAIKIDLTREKLDWTYGKPIMISFTPAISRKFGWIIFTSTYSLKTMKSTEARKRAVQLRKTRKKLMRGS